MDARTLKLRLCQSAMAEDWCAVKVWADVAQEVDLGTTDEGLARVAKRRKREAKRGTICWKCVDAWNDVERELERREEARG